MKVSYSKLLVRGVIATTLLMSMSCQKKGSARGVQPNTTTKAATPADAAKDENKNVKKDSLANLPEGKDRTVVKPSAKPASGDTTEVQPEIASETSSDKTTAAPVVTKKNKEEAAAPVNDKVIVVPVKETKDIDPKICSDEIVKASTQMTSLYKKIEAVDKLSTTPEADRIANYTAYHQLCLDWPKLFTKIESCEGEGKVTRTKNSANLSCVKYALALKDLTGKDNTITLAVAKIRNERMAQLRASKLVVSEEAKELFNKENTSWKMFIVDGELQTDSAKLTDAIKANKVACTIGISSLDKYTHAQNVIVNITAATDLLATDETDQVQKGVELAIRIKATAQDATAEEVAKAAEEKSVILCSNLDHKDLNIKALQKALGKHIAVAASTAPAKEEPKTEEKKEEAAVKQK